MAAFAIIAVNLIFFILIRAIGVYAPESPDYAISLFALPGDPSQIADAPWVIVTAPFTHIEFLHLLLNNLWIACFGPICEYVWGFKRTVLVYSIGLLGGEIAFLATVAISNAQLQFLVGASAGAYALIVATLLTASRSFKLHFKKFHFISENMKWIMVTVILICTLVPFCSGNTVTGLTHCGGGIAGLLTAVYLYRKKALQKGQTNRVNQASQCFQSVSDEMRKTLETIETSGFSSLTSKEKDALFNEK